MKKTTDYNVQVQRQAHRFGLLRMRQAYLRLLAEYEEQELSNNKDSDLCTNESPYTVECPHCNKKKPPQSKAKSPA